MPQSGNSYPPACLAPCSVPRRARACSRRSPESLRNFRSLCSLKEIKGRNPAKAGFLLFSVFGLHEFCGAPVWWGAGDAADALLWVCIPNLLYGRPLIVTLRTPSSTGAERLMQFFGRTRPYNRVGRVHPKQCESLQAAPQVLRKNFSATGAGIAPLSDNLFTFPLL